MFQKFMGLPDGIGSAHKIGATTQMRLSSRIMNSTEASECGNEYLTRELTAYFNVHCHGGKTHKEARISIEFGGSSGFAICNSKRTGKVNASDGKMWGELAGS